MTSPFLTKHDAADYCHTTPLVLERAFHRRELEGMKRGRQLLFRVEWLDAWLMRGHRRAEP